MIIKTKTHSFPPLRFPFPVLQITDDIQKAQGPYFAVLDLYNLFYSVPVTEASKPQFIFNIKGTQSVFARLPMLLYIPYAADKI